MENTSAIEEHSGPIATVEPEVFVIEYHRDLPAWARIVELSYMLCILILGVPGNALIIKLQYMNKDRSSTDILVMTMAALELLCASMNVCMHYIRHTYSIWQYVASPWICTIHSFSTGITTLSSCQLLGAISIDRYIRTCKPYNTFYNKRRAKIVCVVILVISTVFTLPNLQVNMNAANLICYAGSAFSVSFRLLLAFVIVTILMAIFIVVTLAYIRIAILLRQRHNRRIEMMMGSSTVGHPTGKTNKLTAFFNKRKRRGQVAPESNCATASNTVPSTVPSTAPSTSISHLQATSSSTDPNQSTSNATATANIDSNAAVNPTSTGWQRPPLQANLGRDTFNRTTVVMFLISLIYIITWCVSWVSAFTLRAAVLGNGLSHLAVSFYMVNCATNPLIFLSLSSKFREATRLTLCRR